MEKHTSKRDLRKNAHTASNKPPQAPNSNSFHTKKRFPKNRENASIAVIFFQKNALALKNPPKTRIFSVLSNYRIPTIPVFLSDQLAIMDFNGLNRCFVFQTLRTHNRPKQTSIGLTNCCTR